MLCEVIYELDLFSIVESCCEFNPVRAYHGYFLSESIDWENRTMNASYFPYDLFEGALRSLPVTELSVAQFGDGDNGE